MKISIAVSLVFSALTCGISAEEQVNISNPLGLDWPWELVHYDLPAAAQGEMSAQAGNQLRPAQIEPIPGTKQVRAWFIATLKRGEESKAVIFKKVRSESPLSVKPDADRLRIDNGVHQFLIPNYSGKFAAPNMLKDVQPPVLGMKLSAEPEFYGRAWFDGDSQVVSATSEILASGPVFAEIRVTYYFAPDGAVEIPDPKRGFFYECTLRFVMNDPWVDVTENYNLPKETALKLEFKEPLMPDTAMWIPRFDYTPSGHNIHTHFEPLPPSEDQSGLLLSLRPRWNQAPGSSQSFFVTRGGRLPYFDTTENKELRSKTYDPNAPAAGIVATHPAKWLNPPVQSIRVFAKGGRAARVDFPLKKGARAYALLLGPRSQFDSARKLGSLVRRHAEWTLDNQFNYSTFDGGRSEKAK